MASIWDDPEIRSGGEFVRFTEPGDTVAGTIQLIRVHRFDDGKVAPQLLLVSDSGEERTITAGQVGLKAKLAELRPEAGDWISVTMTRIEARAGGRELKHWDLKHRSQGALTDPAARPAPRSKSLRVWVDTANPAVAAKWSLVPYGPARPVGMGRIPWSNNAVRRNAPLDSQEWGSTLGGGSTSVARARASNLVRWRQLVRRLCLDYRIISASQGR